MSGPWSKISPFAFTLMFVQLLAISTSCQNNPVVTVSVHSVEGEPLENAVVFIDDNPETMQVTGPDGIVSFELLPGSFQLSSYRPDYLDYHNQITVSDTSFVYSVIQMPALHWSTTPSNPPAGIGEKNGLRMAAAGDKIYLWSAYSGVPGSTTTDGSVDFYQYDTQTDTWQQLPNTPFHSDYGISTARGKTPQGDEAIYIIKGRWSGQRTWFSRYHIDEGIWENNLAHQIPWRTDLGNQYSGDGFQNYPRNGAALVYTDQGYIYLFPGSGYGYEKYDWYRYSIADNLWTDMGELPHRQGPGNAAVWVVGSDAGLEQDYLYVHFGISPSGDYTEAEFWRYALDSGTWEPLANHGYGADDGSALAWDGNEYIYHSPGAYQEQSWDYGLSQKRELMRYHIPTDSWEAMEKAPYNRWGGWDDGGGMVLIGNTLYAMKGGDDIAWAEGEQPASGGEVANNQFWSYKINPALVELTVKESLGNGNISLPTGSTEHTQGTHIWIEATSAEGWKLDEWLVDDTFYSSSNPIEILMNEDKSVQAVFSEVSTSYNIPEGDDGFVMHTKPGIMYINTLAPAEIGVYDLLGRMMIGTMELSAGSHTIRHKLGSGIYIVRVAANGTIANKKLYFTP